MPRSMGRSLLKEVFGGVVRAEYTRPDGTKTVQKDYYGPYVAKAPATSRVRSEAAAIERSGGALVEVEHWVLRSPLTWERVE